MMNSRRLKRNEFAKGLDQALIQDFYRGIETQNGIMFNKIKIVNLVFVKFKEQGKTYMFENPSDERLGSGYVAVLDEHNQPQMVRVISSIKLPRKYLKPLQIAMCGEVKKLTKIYGVIDIKEIKEEPKSMEFVYNHTEDTNDAPVC